MKNLIHYLTILFLVFFVSSCQKKATLNNVLKINNSLQFTHDKTIRDVKNNFEITIGKHWKRELYYDAAQSRIYAADTTRNFSSSFIIDVTCFTGKIILDDTFTDKLSNDITKFPKNYIINKGSLELQNKPAYCVYSFEKLSQTAIYNIECYLPDGERYYVLKSTINGSEHLSKNVSETIKIFNSLNILP